MKRREFLKKSFLTTTFLSCGGFSIASQIDFIEGRTDMAAFYLAGVAATRQLAKRQMTWMRSMQDALLVDPLATEVLDKVEGLIRSLN